nr:EAL domain-containing protein [Pseudobutyrivibrio sp.]
MLDQMIMAMEAFELQAYYQPQYDAKTGVIGGAEALVRWVKDDGTIISPNDFIPILEKQNSVSIIDWYVCEQACKTIKMLGDKAIKISVNFSRNHVRDEEFLPKLEELVGAYGIDRSLLGIEITESDVANSGPAVIDWVKSIVDAGYTVAIDDFGYGMSSLSFVKDVPAKVLKVDRSFLNDNCQTKKGRVALETIFYFAHRLQMKTVVEGVENYQQMLFLNTCECDYIQGFLFSKPVPQEKFLEMVMENRQVDTLYGDTFENNTVFGKLRVIVEAVYTRFPLVIYTNLTRNTYSVMRKENFLDLIVPQTGMYEEGFMRGKAITLPQYHAAVDEHFKKEKLIEAYNSGKRYVRLVVEQRGKDGEISLVAITDYFYKRSGTDDLYMVTFFEIIDRDEFKMISEH